MGAFRPTHQHQHHFRNRRRIAGLKFTEHCVKEFMVWNFLNQDRQRRCSCGAVACQPLRPRQQEQHRLMQIPWLFGFHPRNQLRHRFRKFPLFQAQFRKQKRLLALFLRRHPFHALQHCFSLRQQILTDHQFGLP